MTLTSEIEDLIATIASRTNSGDAAWRAVTDAGLHRVGIPEDHGGSGGDLAELVAVVVSLTATGSQTPVIESAAADWVLAQNRDLSPNLTTIGRRDGAKALGVRWADVADWVVLIDATGSGWLQSCEPDSLDRDIAGEPVGIVLVGDCEPLGPIPQAAIDRWNLLEIAGLVGYSRAMYAQTLDHVSTREAFGKKLIELAAVATRIGDMRIQLSQAEAALSSATAHAGRNFGAPVLSARIVVARSASIIAAHAHQLHGALGTTREHPLHRSSTGVWARRDHVMSASHASDTLGRLVAAGGEDALWSLTG